MATARDSVAASPALAPTTAPLLSASGNGLVLAGAGHEKKHRTNRCSADGCRVKLGLTPFSCRCQHPFCSKHRYPEEHACQHDYKQDHKKELLKTMSAPIVAAKLDKV